MMFSLFEFTKTILSYLSFLPQILCYFLVFFFKDTFDNVKQYQNNKFYNVEHSKNCRIPRNSNNTFNFSKLCCEVIKEPFDGNFRFLGSFIDSISFLQSLAGDSNQKLLHSFILTKINGKARDLLDCKIDTIEDLKNSLKNVVKPESVDLIKAKMSLLSESDIGDLEFIEKSRQLSNDLRNSFKWMGIPSDTANKFVVNDLVKMCKDKTPFDSVKFLFECSTFVDEDSVFAKFLSTNNDARKNLQSLNFENEFFYKTQANQLIKPKGMCTGKCNQTNSNKGIKLLNSKQRLDHIEPTLIPKEKPAVIEKHTEIKPAADSIIKSLAKRTNPSDLENKIQHASHDSSHSEINSSANELININESISNISNTPKSKKIKKKKRKSVVKKSKVTISATKNLINPIQAKPNDSHESHELINLKEEKIACRCSTPVSESILQAQNYSKVSVSTQDVKETNSTITVAIEKDNANPIINDDEFNFNFEDDFFEIIEEPRKKERPSSEYYSICF